MLRFYFEIPAAVMMQSLGIRCILKLTTDAFAFGDKFAHQIIILSVFHPKRSAIRYFVYRLKMVFF